MVRLSDKFLSEFKELLSLAWPIVLMNLYRTLNPAFSIIMCGNLDKLQFDGASLANTIINVFGVSIGLGFSTSSDTLFAQIYGSKCRERLGLMLQRAILVNTSVFFLVASLHLSIEPILIYLQQDAEISRLTAVYVTHYLPGLFFDFQFLTISRYLQNQNIVLPTMVSAFIGFIFNCFSQYVAIHMLGYGLKASAMLQATACFLMFFCQLLYILISKVYKETWQGFEPYNALEAWGIFFRYGIPGIMMIGIEEWSHEVGSFLAGSMDEIQLAAQTISIQVETFTYVMHISIAIAVSIRCGQLLGSYKPKEAALSARVVIFTDMILSVMATIVLLCLRQYVPYIFTNDREIGVLSEKLLYFNAGTQVLDAGVSAACGIFRACGLQLQAALVMALTHYGIGIPITIFLIFAKRMDIMGFWIGLSCALVVEVIIYIFLVSRINWENEAKRAQQNAADSKLDKFLDIITDNLNFDESNRHFVDNRSLEYSDKRLKQKDNKQLPNEIKENIFGLRLNKKNIIIRRTVYMGGVFTIFVTALSIKILLPREFYVPCIPLINGTTGVPYKHYPWCKDSM